MKVFYIENKILTYYTDLSIISSTCKNNRSSFQDTPSMWVKSSDTQRANRLATLADTHVS